MAMRLLPFHKSNALRWRISALFYSSTTTEVVETSSSSSDTLFSRISPLGDARVSVKPVLDQWVQEGKSVVPSEIRKIIKQLRKFGRFNHALQISEWMNQSPVKPLAGDIAVQLDLISKVHGLEQAEEYFNNVPNSLRGFHIYGALLNCYAHAKSLEKAEATMQMIRELGFARATLPFNVMLHLYSQMGKHEKLEALVQEMEEKGIGCDKITFSIQMNAYAVTCKVNEMERILMKMEADPEVSMDWSTYAVAANGYLRSGLREKALAALKKSEELIELKTRRISYEFLMTLYARIGKKDAVSRIWKKCKKTRKVYNSSYICMISSLMTMDDLNRMEKIFEQWKAREMSFDYRIPNLVITAYCRKGLLGKAESIVDWLRQKGKEPVASTWDRLAAGYSKYNHMDKAVDTLKKAILVIHPGWKPNVATFAACIKYLKGKGDEEFAEFTAFLEERIHNPKDIYDRVEHYMKNRDLGSEALNEMESADHDEEVLEGETLDGGIDLKTNINMKAE